MRETFEAFKARIEDEQAKREQAKADAPRQFDALVASLAQFNGKAVLGGVLQWVNRSQSLVFENVWAVPRQKFSEVWEPKISFWTVTPPQNPGEQARSDAQENWSLCPGFEGGHFVWTVFETGSVFTNEELAAEAAKNMVLIHLHDPRVMSDGEQAPEDLTTTAVERAEGLQLEPVLGNPGD